MKYNYKLVNLKSQVMFCIRLCSIFLVSLVVLSGKSFAAYSLEPFENESARTTLLVPATLIGKEVKTQYGINWQSSTISIDALKFAPERSLQLGAGPRSESMSRRVDELARRRARTARAAHEPLGSRERRDLRELCVDLGIVAGEPS